MIESHVFQFGQDWSKSPEIHQQNSSGSQLSVPDSMANTDDTVHSDTTSVSDSNKEITVSTHENPKLVVATIVNEDESLVNVDRSGYLCAHLDRMAALPVGVTR